MPPTAEPKRMLSAEEYLELERHAEDRHEYFRGEIFAMTGGTRRHTQIAVNLASELRAALRDRPCLVVGSDLRIAIPALDLYTYPDVAVVCGPARFTDEREESLENPGVIVEVLSPSTESYDRGRKFQHYKAIPSLEHYVLVSQDGPLVEHFARQAGGGWLMTEHGRGERLELKALGVSIAVDEIYLKVFDAPAA